MPTYSEEDIILRAKQIANKLSTTDEVDYYKRAEKQINANVKVQQIISQMKQLQKQAVNLQHYQKFEALKQVEAKIATLEEQLYELPIVQEFQRAQVDVNELLQLVASTITKEVSDQLQKEE